LPVEIWDETKEGGRAWEENFDKSSERIQEVEKGFASPLRYAQRRFEMSSFTMDFVHSKRTQNPKQYPTQDDSRTKALAYKQFYMYDTIC
jgi:hypothetical protein